jgi:hypothetical protein
VATTDSAHHALVYRDGAFVNFRDHDFPEGSGHGYRWVQLKRFHLPGAPPPDRGLLAALIAHPEFRDTYDGAGVWREPRHGQWWSDRITPGAYRAVSEAGALRTLHAWARAGAPPPPDLEARLDEAAYTPVRRATSRFTLGPLPEDAQHDYGPVHTEFHELVLIDRRVSTMTLLVAADD